MNSLHISHLDDSVFRRLEEMAREQRISIEEVVRRYLNELRATGAPSRVQDRNVILRKSQGRWSEEDVREFERATAPMREIDSSLWQ